MIFLGHSSPGFLGELAGRQMGQWWGRSRAEGEREGRGEKGSRGREFVYMGEIADMEPGNSKGRW